MSTATPTLKKGVKLKMFGGRLQVGKFVSPAADESVRAHAGSPHTDRHDPHVHHGTPSAPHASRARAVVLTSPCARADTPADTVDDADSVFGVCKSTTESDGYVDFESDVHMDTIPPEDNCQCVGRAMCEYCKLTDKLLTSLPDKDIGLAGSMSPSLKGPFRIVADDSDDTTFDATCVAVARTSAEESRPARVMSGRDVLRVQQRHAWPSTLPRTSTPAQPLVPKCTPDATTAVRMCAPGAKTTSPAVGKCQPDAKMASPAVRECAPADAEMASPAFCNRIAAEDFEAHGREHTSKHIHDLLEMLLQMSDGEEKLRRLREFCKLYGSLWLQSRLTADEVATIIGTSSKPTLLKRVRTSVRSWRK